MVTHEASDDATAAVSGLCATSIGHAPTLVEALGIFRVTIAFPRLLRAGRAGTYGAGLLA